MPNDFARADTDNGDGTDECPECGGDAKFNEGNGPYCGDCEWTPGIYGDRPRQMGVLV